tara:strand:- start:5388 stop:5873 length:486 start_codon:yes stop_codon:yes gene_type:complete
MFENTQILKGLIGLNIINAFIAIKFPYFLNNITTLVLSLLFYFYYNSNKRTYWYGSMQNLIKNNNYPKLYIDDDNYLITKACTDNLWTTASKEKDNPLLNNCKDSDNCQNTELTCKNLINIINNQVKDNTYKLPKSYNTFHLFGNGEYSDASHADVLVNKK